MACVECVEDAARASSKSDLFTTALPIFSPGLPVRIEGFSNDSNCIRGKALSQARAQLVKDCLLKSGCTKLGSGGDFPKGRWR